MLCLHSLNIKNVDAEKATPSPKALSPFGVWMTKGFSNPSSSRFRQAFQVFNTLTLGTVIGPPQHPLSFLVASIPCYVDSHLPRFLSIFSFHNSFVHHGQRKCQHG